MKKLKQKIALLFIMSVLGAKAQYCSSSPANCQLVCNGGFETIVGGYPNYTGDQTAGYYPINTVTNWSSIVGSPDLFHALSPPIVSVPCNVFGTQNAHGGQAYAGIFMDGALSSGFIHGYHEQIATQLVSAMVAGKIYDIELYVSKADLSDRLNKNLVLDFGFGYTPIIVPAASLNDAVNWVKISYAYCALGGEDVLYISSNDNSPFTYNSAPPTGCPTFSGFGPNIEPYLYIDDVSIKEAKFSIANTTACLNQSSNFTLNSLCGVTLSNYNFSWNFGDGTPVVNTGSSPNSVHTFATNGAYIGTVTVTGGACSVNYTFSVNVPLALITINSSTTSICNGSANFSAVVSPAVAYIYSWEVTDATTNALLTVPITNGNTANPSINFASINQNVNVCVTIVNSLGCITKQCIFMPSCCAKPPLVTKYTNTTFTSNTSISSASVIFAGIITVNTGVTLAINNTNVTIDPNTRFILNGTSNLNLTNVYLHGCNAMWDGIYPRGTSTVLMNNCRIEDAKRAIVDSLGGAKLNLTNNYFNKNYNAIVFKAIKTSVSTVALTNNLFTCVNITVPASAPWVTTIPSLANAATFSALPATTLLTPYNTAYPNGIQILSASHTGKPNTAIVIGGSSTNQENVFDKLNNGIINSGSFMQIQNNVFQNMKIVPSVSSFNNVGIVCIHLFNSGPFYTGVGGSTNLRNTFINNDFGITSFGRQTLLTTYNIFNTQTTGIFVNYNNSNSTVNIRNNNFNQNLIGVNCSNNTAINVSIKDNNFNNTAAIVGDYTNNFAIRCTEATLATNPASYPAFTIDNNNISGYFNGIYASQTLSLTAFDNEVHMQQDNVSDHWQAGIFITNSNAATINNNTIDMPGLNPWAYWQAGVRATANQVPRVRCNSVNNLNMALMFDGNNYTAANNGVIGNYMQNANVGVWLVGLGEIGNQAGSTGSNSADNSWATTCNLYTYAQSSSNVAGNMFRTRSTVPFNLPNSKAGFDGSPSINFFGTNNSVAGTGVCTANASTPSNLKVVPQPLANLMQTGEEIATDYTTASNLNSPNFVSANTLASSTNNQAATKAILRKNLLSNILLQQIDTQSSPALSSFMSLVPSQNTGLLQQVDVLIHQAEVNISQVATAQVANNIITPLNVVEQSQQQFNALYLLYLAQVKKINPSQMMSLEAIALQCPTDYGTAVYQARTLLFDIKKQNYLSPCEKIVFNAPSNMRINNADGNEVAVNQILVYPNPASSLVFVDVKGYANISISLFNLIGELVLNTELNNGQHFDASNLASGAYIYKVYTATSELKVGKLIITH
jgi:Secretion system C-terminal sorting domain/PKD domain